MSAPVTILSVLIPSTLDRSDMLDRLVLELNNQAEGVAVEILTEVDSYELSIGNKRNVLLQKARGEYVVFVDSDDTVADNYIYEILMALEQSPDALGIEGFMTVDGKDRKHWKISKDFPYEARKDKNGNEEYVRFTNHLAPVKRSIALQIGYKDLIHGEDYDYAVRLRASGLIKTEIYIAKELYHYKFRSRK